MSDLNLNKTINIQDEENAISYSNEQENPDSSIDMDLVQKETAEPGALRIAESKNLLCIDMETSIEPPNDKNGEIEIAKLVNVPDFKINIISQRAGRRKFTIMGLYDLFGMGQQAPRTGQQAPGTWSQAPGPWQQAPPPQQQWFTRQLWRQEQPQPQQQQTMWTQYGPGPHGYTPRYPNPEGYPTGDGGYQGAYGYEGGGPLLYDPRSRNSFVRLVMGIVFVMLLATAIFLAIVLTNPELKHFFRVAGWLIVLPAAIGLLVTNCAMMCSPCARRPPCNFICLTLTTAAMCIISAKITSHYRTEIIFYAVIATTATVFVCVLLAFSKFDFTSYLLYIVGISVAFSVIVMIIIITMVLTGTMMKPVILVILFVGTLIQIVLLTMELQMILGGRSIEISEADYAIAAFLLYTSILDVFLKMVQIIGLLQN